MDSRAATVRIDVSLVQRLIGEQFPQFADLPIKPVATSGWDNRTFHLGDAMSVRLPSAEHYASAVAKEQHWLPRIAPHLPLPVPTPLAMGHPGAGFPWHWSIYKWLPGDIATVGRITDLNRFAAELARFLKALQSLDATAAPTPGDGNTTRGGPLAIYDGAARSAIDALRGEVDVEIATAIWESALDSVWQRAPVWVHGDVAAGNLLVRNGVLVAVIDFGQLVVGDPACDLVIAWTLLTPDSREVFRIALGVDAGTWSRGRGWALWKALIIRANHIRSNAGETQAAPRVIEHLFADYVSARR